MKNKTYTNPTMSSIHLSRAPPWQGAETQQQINTNKNLEPLRLKVFVYGFLCYILYW